MAESRVAVVTGGTSGIGLAIARRHLADGDRVVIGSIDVDKYTTPSLGLDEDRARLVKTDVSVESNVEALVAAAVEAFGQVDVMVNNAGLGGGSGGTMDLDPGAFRPATEVLLDGVAFGIKHAARVMAPRQTGSIVNIASIAGLSTYIASGHMYGACKAAVIQLTKSTALEMAQHNVRINAICPGFIATGWFGRGMGMADEELPATIEAAEQAFTKLQPIRRAGKPADIAAAAAWLSSSDASFVTGHALVVDGGACLGREWTQEYGRGKLIRDALNLKD